MATRRLAATPAPPTAIAPRNGASAVKLQSVQPDAASSANAWPASVATYTRPSATVGCPRASTTSPRLNAQRTSSLGTSAADSPAAACVWYRLLAASRPHAAHCPLCVERVADP